MSTHNIPLCYRKSKIYPFMPPDLALLLTHISSNYPCLEPVFMVPKVFEPLKFCCIILSFQSATKIFIIFPQSCYQSHSSFRSNIRGYVGKPYHWKAWHYSVCCIREKLMNRCTHISKKKTRIRIECWVSFNRTQSDLCHAGREFLYTQIF